MSSDLYWKPCTDYNGTFSFEVKSAFRMAFGEPVDVILDERNLSLLRGMSIGGVVGVDEVIEAINRHGTVHVKELW